MTVRIKIECPKCHADRTMLDSCFGVPGYITHHPKHAAPHLDAHTGDAEAHAEEPPAHYPHQAQPSHEGAHDAVINTNAGFKVRLVLCPRCHYVEMYHDVGLDSPC